MKKTLSLWLTLTAAALLAVLGLASVRTHAATIADPAEHSGGDHCICAGHSSEIASQANHSCTNLTWTAWTDDASLPTATGNYYLTGNVLISNPQLVEENATVNLCLNGQTVTTPAAGYNVAIGNTTSKGTQLYVLSNGSTLSITDCTSSSETGKTGAGAIVVTSTSGTSNAGGIFRGWTGTGLESNRVSTLSYTVNLYYGNFDASGYYASLAPLGYFYNGNLNVYGGTLKGGTKSKNADTAGSGLLYICKKMKMYGGTITGGKSSKCAGNVNISNGGTLDMYGGTIEKGESNSTGASAITTHGGNIYINSGTVTLYGGTVKDGTATSTRTATSGTTAAYACGGNVSIAASGTLIVDGGTISGGTASSTYTSTSNGTTTTKKSGCGGNIYTKGALELKSGNFTGGSSNNTGGSIQSEGGTVKLSGGTISGSTATSTGKVAYSISTTYTIEGSVIAYSPSSSVHFSLQNGNTVTMKGGYVSNIQAAGTSTVNVSGGVLTDLSVHNGTANVSGGVILNNVNIYAYANGGTYSASTGTTNISGGYINKINQPTGSTTLSVHLNISGGFFKTAPAVGNADGVDRSYLTLTGQMLDYANSVSYTTTSTTASTLSTTKVVTNHCHEVCVNADDGAVNTDNFMDVYFIPWDKTDSLPTVAGNYYLTTNVKVTKQYNPAVDVNLCLNGHTIEGSKTTVRPIMMQQTAVLSVCDCQTGENVGSIKGATLSSGTAGTVGVSGQTVGAEPVFKFYSGKLIGGTVNASGDEDGGGVFGINKGGVVEVYGGEIVGGSTAGHGGAVIVRAGLQDKTDPTTLANGVFVMRGGKISGSTLTDATHHGTAIAVTGGVLLISGGEIAGDSANTVWCSSAADTIRIDGGKIGGFTAEGFDPDDYCIEEDAYFAVKPSDDYADERYRFFDGSGVAGYDYTLKQVWLVETSTALQDGTPVNVGGSVSGGGYYAVGETVTLTAFEPGSNAISGYEFVRWLNGDLQEVGTDATYTFTATASDQLFLAIYAPKATAGGLQITVLADSYTYKIGDAAAVEGTPAGFTASVGDEVTLVYTGTKEFDSWVNNSGKMVSREATWTFTVNSEVTFTANAADTTSVIVIFFNANYQILSSSLLEELTRIPDVPTAIGKINGRWELNGEAVVSVDVLKAMQPTGTTVSIVAAYDAGAETYVLTVLGRIEETTGTPDQWTALPAGDISGEEKAITEITEVTAKDVDGQTFQYFADATGEILSRSKTTTFRYAADQDVYAVYSTAAAATSEPTVKIIVARNTGSSVYFEALRNVPDGYTLVEQGILFTTDSKRGALSVEDALTVGSTACFKYVSNGKAPNDVTGLLIKNAPEKVYAKGYLIYTDGSNQYAAVSAETGEATPTADLIPVQNMFTGLTAQMAKRFYYYFYQLDETEQTVYNEVATGIIASAAEINVSGNLSPDDFQTVVNSIYADQPDLFWYGGSFTYYTSNGNVVKAEPDYRYYADLAAEKAALESVKDTVLATVASMTDDQKIRYIHDYVALHVLYVYNTGYDQTAHNALVNGEAVCAGYARSVQYLAMAAGIPCFYCEGEAFNGNNLEAHGWNIVLLNGNYYNLDATWDDYDSSNPSAAFVTADYYLITDAVIEQDHTRLNLGTLLPACTVEYPYAAVYGNDRALDPIIRASGVTRIVNSLAEYKALRKEQLIQNGPGTVNYQYVVTASVYNEILEYNNDQTLRQQEFQEAATALGLNGYQYGFGWDFLMQTAGALVVNATDQLVAN